MTSVDRSPSERVDVCIVGAGPGGALPAYVLAKRGYDVVVLDAGPRFEFEERLERMKRSLRPAHDNKAVWEMGGERDAFTSSGDWYYPLNKKRVKGVGGTTLHWSGIVPRLHPEDFEMRSRYGVASDWPIAYSDLKEYYATAKREIGVSGRDDDPFGPPRDVDYPMPAFPPSRSDEILTEAAAEAGVTFHSAPRAQNSEAYDSRSPCQGFGTCAPVCPSGAKYSADVHVRKAEDHGARVIDRAAVQRLEHDDAGDSVTAAVYATPSGETYRQRARTFVLACGAIETPRLLLLSTSSEYPDGLANSSGHVGEYLMTHFTVAVGGRVNQPTEQQQIGFATSMSNQFYTPDEAPPGSFEIVLENNQGDSITELALGTEESIRSVRDVAASPGDVTAWTNAATAPFQGVEWGDELFETLREQYGNRIGINAIVEHLPRRRSRVTLDTSRTDDNGNPVPDLAVETGAFERKTKARAIEVMQSIAANLDGRVDVVAGVDDAIVTAHQMGTTRMGTDPESSVVTPRMRTHDLSNLYISSSSVFVTGGAVSPTLTIAALALKCADHISEDL